MRVEIWSDVVCPWCYVGTRRFDQALERLRAGGGWDDVEVVHRALEGGGHADVVGAEERAASEAGIAGRRWLTAA